MLDGMEDYDSRDFPTAETWGSRFPQDAVGSSELQNVPFTPEGHQTAWRIVSRLQPVKTSPPVPRLFVSHRQADHSEGLRAAELAAQNGFYFWLDVLDPTLQRIPHLSLNPLLQALVTAIVIEVALLNSSHVLALVTTNTAGSLWVPYEYGRVKSDVLFSLQAGCWNHPKTVGTSRAEYLELGKDTYNEVDIHSWLSTEYKQAMGVYPAPRAWPYPATTPLP